MSCVPVPALRPNPEDALVVNLANEIPLEKDKRLTAISVDSHYSQPSFIEPVPAGPIDRNEGSLTVNSARIGPNYYRPGTPSSVRSVVPSVLYPTDVTRVPSITSPGKTGNNYYHRPGTPGSVSVRSATTSRSSTQGLTNSRYNYVYPSRVPTPTSSIRLALSSNAQPPNEPLSRQGTPVSVVSYQDPIVTVGLYDQRYPRWGLTPGVRDRNTSQPLTHSPDVSVPPLVQPFSSRGASSVPRSPSPQNLTFKAPIPAVSALLPTYPGRPMGPYHGSHGVHEVRRHGSVPDIGANKTPIYTNSHYRTATSDHPGASINNFAVRRNNKQDGNIQRLRQI